jgi:diguanylate cyclase (GGDEF)-like protein
LNSLRQFRSKYQRWGLVRRIVLLSVALLLLIQIAVQTVVRSSIEDSVRLNLQRELSSDERVWSRLVEQNAQRLQLGASVLASDFGFRAAVSSADADTIESALENHGARIGATISAFLNPEFQLTAMANPKDAGVTRQNLVEVGQSMARDGQQGRMALVQGRLHQFVMVPVRAPLVVGWVVMGFAVDQSLATDMQALSGAQVIIVNHAGEANQQVIYSTLPGPSAAGMALPVDTRGTLEIGDEEFAIKYVVLPGSADGLKAILLRSSPEAHTVFDRMQKVLLLIDGFALLLFAVGASLMARRVAKPLDLLVTDTERLGRGDYTQPVNDFGRHDEVGNLARSFDRMRLNIQASQSEIRQLAYWDRLTGLPNQAQLREALLSMLAKESTALQHAAVIVLDLDRLKHINDVLGYSFGDRVLQVVAQRLTGLAQSEKALAARVTGGEFALLLGACDAERALTVARQITLAFEEPVTLDSQTVDLSAGMGIACWPEHADQVDVLLGRAELAMYAAKRKSMGTLVYDPSLDSGSAQTLSLLTELRQAIDRNELRLFLQPKIGLSDHRVSAAEALVRWQHPTRGMVPPMEFIPFAEQTGFVRYLTLWMFEEVVRQWRSLQPSAGLLRIAINLSTRDLMDLEFPAKIDALLAKYDVPRDGLCLEITESAIMDDPQRAEATLNQLSSSGYKLSIDDFGTGYSSLAYLKRLPVNELKIDKSFVMGMETDASDAKIVRSTIDLAHNLGLTVVAEGVESAHIYDMLAELHCDEGQGYHMSRPLPASDFNAWRARWESQRS